MTHRALAAVFTAGLLSALLLPPSSEAGAQTVAPQPVKAADLGNPRDAGIRYGQAAGMAVVCLDMKPTAKAEQLAASFSGADLEAFKVQAEAIVQSWKKTLTCAHNSDPNPCRLAHQISCREGYKEIGPEGTAAPGLVERAAAAQ